MNIAEAIKQTEGTSSPAEIRKDWKRVAQEHQSCFGQWQPIKTAPQDGTQILLWLKWGPNVIGSCNSFNFDDATHWMQLPEGPK